MTKDKLFTVFISAFIALTLVVAVGCGEKRKKSATGGQPECTKNCDAGKRPEPKPHGKYVKGWSNNFNISSAGAYRDFLRDYGICNPPGWYELGWRCKDWDNSGGYFHLEVERTSLPAKGGVTFRAIHTSSGTYRDIPILGEFAKWNDSQGFAMWENNNVFDLDDPALRGLLQVHVEKGDLSERRFKVEIFYRDRKMGYSYVSVNYDEEDKDEE